MVSVLPLTTKMPTALPPAVKVFSPSRDSVTLAASPLTDMAQQPSKPVLSIVKLRAMMFADVLTAS